ncbi:hypothetical protein HG531_012634 [Fusarium graminearum]|nr:hypothetical protein HG531_012634 [Fusarium graminearum]
MRVRKDRQSRATRSQTNDFGVNGDGRHHQRTESSGEEDKPLEISMTKMNQRRSSNQPSPPIQKEDSVSSEINDGYGSGDTTPRPYTNGSSLTNGDKKNTSRRKSIGLNKSKNRNKSLVKLKSSDDLLGRRMQGLASGLTGMVGDDD